MYPFVRFAKEMWKARRLPPLSPTGVHVSHHICWPWDLDPWIELNNGRTLTLYDLGRIPLAVRTGIIGVMRRKRWGIAVAGNSTRYRRRVKMFERFTMVSYTIGWDDKFLYMDQSLWRKGECLNQMLLRAAITSAQGIVPPALAMKELGLADQSPPLPEWVDAWIKADALRPWPPVVPSLTHDDVKTDLPS